MTRAHCGIDEVHKHMAHRLMSSRLKDMLNTRAKNLKLAVRVKILEYTVVWWGTGIGDTIWSVAIVLLVADVSAQ